MNAKIEVELQQWMGSDRDIANAAWTSTYNKDRREQRTDEECSALVTRLIADGHSTPVESVVLRFWIRMPVFTDRQHMTHRIASHNGLSGRYRTMPDDWYSLPQDCRDIVAKINYGAGERMAKEYDELCAEANKRYSTWLEFLKKGKMASVISESEYKRVREMVRAVLPVAGMVERTTVLNLRSFANYQKLRNSNHAQPEIHGVAAQMLEQVKAAKVAPAAIAALEARGWVL